MFLGGLAYDAHEEDLRKDFSKYGDLEDVQLPISDQGNKHKGFAFLTYKDPADASYAVKEHHQREYMGREISAKIVVPRSERQGSGGERPGDWICPSCSASVFGSKSACYKCGEPKPSGGGGGGGRYERRDDRHGGRDDRYDDRRRDDRYDDRRRDDRYDDRRRDDRDRRRDDRDDDYDRRDRRRDDRDDDYDRRDRRRD